MRTTPRLTALALCSGLTLTACGQGVVDGAGEGEATTSVEQAAPSEGSGDGASSGAGEAGESSGGESSAGGPTGDGSSQDGTGGGPSGASGDDATAGSPAPGGDEGDGDEAAPTDGAPSTEDPAAEPGEDGTQPGGDAPGDGQQPGSPSEPGAPGTPSAPGETTEPATTAPGDGQGPGTTDPGTPSEPSGPTDPGTPSVPSGPTSPSDDPSQSPEPSPTEGWGDWVSYGGAADQRYATLPGEPGKGVVVLVHGGGWVGGDAEAFMDESSRKYQLVERMHEQGLWVVTVEYRKTDRAAWPATADDVHAGVSAAVAEARGQGAGQGVGLFGDSAGAHLVALEALRHPGTVDAVVGYFGIYDPLTAKAQRTEQGCPDATAAEDHLFMQDATDPALKERIERTASPVALASGSMPPMFMLHGSADCTAPARQSQQMQQALAAKGATAKLSVVPGAVHSQPEFWTGDEHLSAVTSWFTSHGVR